MISLHNFFCTHCTLGMADTSVSYLRITAYHTAYVRITRIIPAYHCVSNKSRAGPTRPGACPVAVGGQHNATFW